MPNCGFVDVLEENYESLIRVYTALCNLKHTQRLNSSTDSFVDQQIIPPFLDAVNNLHRHKTAVLMNRDVLP